MTSPLTSVLPSAHGPVIAVLVRAGEPLTGRRVAELTSPQVSQTQTATVLRSLAEAGLVSVTPAGTANLYSINREHLLYEGLHELVTAKERLWARMTELATGWTSPPVAVVVFGSAARGDGSTTSDIDVLVVRPAEVDDDDPAWQEGLSALVAQVRRWTGNNVDLLSCSPHELESMAERGETLLTNIRTDGRFLIGNRSSVPSPKGSA
ncbi:nucleotidyltransferase domain-containing protein [Cellulomonas sp. P22]